jgi:hypothetical protein
MNVIQAREPEPRIARFELTPSRIALSLLQGRWKKARHVPKKLDTNSLICPSCQSVAPVIVESDGKSPA